MSRGTLGVAAAAAALLGWLTLLVVGRTAGPTSYVVLATIWSVFYAVLGLLAGLQQQLTLTAVRSGQHAGRSALLSVAVLAVPLAVVGGGAAVLALGGLDDRWVVGVTVSFGALGATGLISALAMAAASGDEPQQARLLLVDAVGRLGLVGGVAISSLPDVAFGAAMALSGWSWLIVGRRTIRGVARGRAAVGPFLRGAVPLTLSAGCLGLLAAGMPLLVSTAWGTSPTAGVLAGLVLLRSPVLALVLVYRPLMLATFSRSHARSGVRLRVLGVGCLGALVLGVLAALSGPAALRLVMGSTFTLSPLAAGAFAASAALLSTGVVLGLVVVAAGQDGSHLVAWLLAVLVTWAVLVWGPVGEAGVALACLAGPAVLIAVVQGSAGRVRKVGHG